PAGTEHLLPRWAGRDILPPPCHVPPGGEQLRLVRGANDVVGTGEVAKIRERELVPGQEPALRQPPLVHAEHLSQLRFVLSTTAGPASTSCSAGTPAGRKFWLKPFFFFYIGGTKTDQEIIASLASD
ncbi:hypothetical protein BHE74_00025090, partial [Ensete ventricosum]